MNYYLVMRQNRSQCSTHCLRAEVERIEREEGELLDALLKARHEAGLPRFQFTVGTMSPAVLAFEP